MKFYGVRKVVGCDSNYSQFLAIDDFWDQMIAKYPGMAFLCLGFNWGQDSFEYCIGKLDDNWAEDLESIEIPDDGWREFECPRNDDEITEMYQQIWNDGKLDYEIEERLEDTLKVRVHYANSERSTA